MRVGSHIVTGGGGGGGGGISNRLIGQHQKQGQLLPWQYNNFKFSFFCATRQNIVEIYISIYNCATMNVAVNQCMFYSRIGRNRIYKQHLTFKASLPFISRFPKVNKFFLFLQTKIASKLIV
jgi:hypothetical protein